MRCIDTPRVNRLSQHLAHTKGFTPDAFYSLSQHAMPYATLGARPPTGPLERLRQRFRRREENRDLATVSSVHTLIQGLNIANRVFSAPSERSSEALPVGLRINALAERISTMKADPRDRQDTMNTIKGLENSLNETLRQISSFAHAQPYVQSCKDTASQTTALIKRAAILAITLQGIVQSEETQRRRFYERPWFSRSDTSDTGNLNNIRQRIDSAMRDANIPWDFEIRDALAHMAADLEKHRNLELNEDIWAALNALSPADASYKSFENEESCVLTGTRSAMLKYLVQWATKRGSKERVLVLYDQAGQVKSSISHAFCRQLPEGVLGASFLFLRMSAERSDAHRVFPTIAYQLAESIPSLRLRIANAALKHHPGRGQALEHQLRTLILSPLKNLRDSATRSTLVFVLDAVHECANTPVFIVPLMLRLLCQAAHEIPFLRILITTRPESYILDAIHPSDHLGSIRWRYMPQDEDVGSHVRLFIEIAFRNAAPGRFQLLMDRPNAMEELIVLSDGRITWARAAVRLIFQDTQLATRFYDILLVYHRTFVSRGGDVGFDDLYMTFLKSSFERFEEDEERMYRIHQVLAWSVTKLYTASKDLPADYLSILGISAEIVKYVTERLRLIRACLPSFLQFLTDPTRCIDLAFLVDSPSGHALIAASLLDFLAGKNWNKGLMRDYAKDHWDGHLLQARYTPELGRALRGFVETHLEDWLWHQVPFFFQLPAQLRPVDVCVQIRNWYEKNGPVDGLVAALDGIINRRVRSLIVEAAESTDYRESNLRQIGQWVAANFYVLDGEVIYTMSHWGGLRM